MKGQNAGNAVLIVWGLMGLNPSSLAGEITLEGAVVVEAVASDNLSQTDEDEESDLVFSVSPLLRLDSQAGRLNWNLQFSAEAEMFARNRDANRIEPVVAGGLEAELIPENLFLEGLVSLRQSYTSGLTRGFEGRAGGLAEDRTGVFTLALSPIWRSDLQGVAELLGSYRFEHVRADNVLEGSNNHRVGVELVSGRRFQRLDWGVSYTGEWFDRNDVGADGEADDGVLSRQQLRARADYQLNDDWALSAVLGYAGGEGNNTRGEATDGGVYWSLGGVWNPSRIFSFELLLGPENREFQFTFSPSRRTDLAVSVIDREVGREAGRTWDGRLTHRTRYSRWVVVYEESTTSLAETAVPDLIGNPALDDVENILDPGSTLGITSEDYFRRRLQASVDYNRGRTDLGLRGAFERREFNGGGDTEQTWEVGVSWRRLVGRRTSAVVTVDWENATFRDDRDETLISLGLGLAYLFSEDLQGLIGFTHLDRDTSDSVDDFRENRLGLLLRMEF